jgi:cytochrome b pre-mRNA-processing protein 3
MLGFLFRGLTAEPRAAAALFEQLTREARQSGWYIGGQVPDTIDGRFAVLATATALALVRFEQEGEAGKHASVALTERFIEVMESEHRELGISDPTLGKTVRKLVGMLGRRTELWRSAVNGDADWTSSVRVSLYANIDVAPDALETSSTLAKRLSRRLAATPLRDLEQGSIA